MKELNNLWKICLRFCLLCLLFFCSFTGYSQVGCSKKEIEARDSLFATCEIFDSCYICTVSSGELFVFNFNEYGYCTSMIAYSDYKSNAYVRIIQAFSCKGIEWWSSINYDYSANVTVFKMLGK